MSLKELRCNKNKLLRLDLRENTELVELHCSKNKLSVLCLNESNKLLLENIFKGRKVQVSYNCGSGQSR